jgi:hypothetical protein
MPLFAIKSHYQKVKALYLRYEHWLMPILIFWGFIYHYATFKVIPIEEVLYLVFAYLALATLAIIFIHLYDQGKITKKLHYIRLFMPLALQFGLGSVIGGVAIFYWFSGSIFTSWPFIVLILLLIITIEAFKHHLEKPVVQFSLYTFATFVLLAVALPYFLRSLSPWLFVMAGIISIGLVIILLYITKSSPVIARQKRAVIISSITIFVIMNFLYFANLIPPVPLSIREVGVYHSVTRTGKDYLVTAEPQHFWKDLRLIPIIHLGPAERAYVFTAIYSPTDLDTTIVHDWQRYDTTKQAWTSMSQISFQVLGGRQDGYRGYTLKNNLPAGQWRVLVKTPRGQVLGRLRFDIERVNEPPVLEQIKK